MSRNDDLPRQKYAPDHGESFVPGSESAPKNLAPQTLDHFKRGYRERAHLRDRESSGMNENFHRRGAGSYQHQQRHSDRDRSDGGHRGSNARSHRGSSYNDRRSSGGGDRGDDRSRNQMIMGLDVQALVDRLYRNSNEVFRELNAARDEHSAVFQSGKAVTAIISNLARRRNLRLASIVWDWIDSVKIKKNTFHYNSMISACEKVRDFRKALTLLDEMKDKQVSKNEVTFSSAISACEKCGQWRIALDLLEQMKKEGAGQTAIAYNAAISACEKGLVPRKAVEIFEQMKREGVRPTVVTYSALISAAEKGQQWKLALEVLEEMKAAGHGANVIAYSAAISALSKGQMWHKALELFREIEASGGKPSIVTYNATMTALEKGLQWERALDLFDEMKTKNLPITVVSYGSAISACEKGLQYRQCLEFLDEMTQMGIKKNVIIFGAAMSCMEKSCRADIAFQLMERMKEERVAPNVHIYNSAISACARCNLWEKGYELFQEMDQVGVSRDVVTYNAVLDAVCSQIELGRKLFKEGVERGFYARVSRLGSQWLELDLHFLSLGGGEIALGWWFEECLVAYLMNTSRLEAVQSISIVTGYGKTRSRGARMNDDGMRLRVGAMLEYMNISESPQANKGRIHINKAALIDEVKKKRGKIDFDIEGYIRWKEKATTANKFPDVPQQVRARFRPAQRGEGPPGTFIREGGGNTPPPRQNESLNHQEMGNRETRRDPPPSRNDDSYQSERHESRRPSGYDDRRPTPDGYHRSNEERPQNRRGSYNDRNLENRGGYSEDFRGGNGRQERRGNYGDQPRRPKYRDQDERGYGDFQDKKSSYNDHNDRKSSFGDNPDRRGGFENRGSHRDFDHQHNFDRRGSRGDYNGQSDRYRDDNDARMDEQRSHFGNDRRHSSGHNDDFPRSRHSGRDRDMHRDSGFNESGRNGDRKYQDHSQGNSNEAPGRFGGNNDSRRSNDYYQEPRSSNARDFSGAGGFRGEDGGESARKRSLDEYHKQQPATRGYNVEPAFTKRRTSS